MKATRLNEIDIDIKKEQEAKTYLPDFMSAYWRSVSEM